MTYLSDDLPSEKQSYDIITLKNETIWENRAGRKFIEEWLSNFKGEIFNIEYERQLALWLLANFVFYNEKEVRHFCKNLYNKFIHWALLYYKKQHSLNMYQSLENILQKTMFIPLGQPSESGAFVLYFFRQENSLPIDVFTFPSSDRRLPIVDNYIIIDDATISGEQSTGDRLDNIIRGISPEKTKILLTFLATDNAIKLLNDKGISVISCNIIDDRCKCFSDKSTMFDNYKNDIEKCREFARYYGNKIYPTHPLGYRDGQYAFGFFYNIPDNSLPIFWSEDIWIPIFRRYQKNTNLGEIYNDIGRFI